LKIKDKKKNERKEKKNKKYKINLIIELTLKKEWQKISKSAMKRMINSIFAIHVHTHH